MITIGRGALQRAAQSCQVSLEQDVQIQELPDGSCRVQGCTLAGFLFLSLLVQGAL